MTDAPTIGPDLARSWLLVNGLHTDRFTHVGQADIVVLDIEDAVAPANKAQARENVVQHLSSGEHHAWVRINGFGTEWWEADLKSLAALPGLEGIFLAMVEGPEHVMRTAAMLPDGTPIVALVETARGITYLPQIAASRHTFRLAFGLGDYRRDTGFDDDPTTLAYTRSQFTIASKAAGLPGAIDGPAVGATGVALADSAGVTSQFGMTGKICLMPEQTPIVNEILAPSINDMSWALDFLKEFNEAGAEIRNGSDLPRLARANKILTLAQAFGLTPPDGYHHFPAPSDTYHC
ncbi:citrate lyase subunit beta/citryl-CoA lyase [Luteococcus japonicus]|uniref:Citrate lyase subunit beta/citryl-CoA lyase n=1 Tax=Luteococcus japonicus TaxID=33984 RepID=A0A3N1ZQY0_9ACTN|nr:CoA ester lyase [Luteococcus japonicus]ROR53311.1 citrate lyase subunit beta/citryl-CoA lyase [Luteococcus japonicus]